MAGVRLGAAISHLAAKVREESLAKTTPALVNVAAKVVDAEAGRRAEAVRRRLIEWFEGHGIPIRPDGELAGLFGAIARSGGWMMQQTLSTAIGFGVGSAMSAVFEPFFLDMQKAVYSIEQNRDLSPTELAALAARGWIEPARLHDEAKNAGVAPERSDLLRRLNEVPLNVTEVLELLRRGHVDEAEADRRLHHLGVPEDARAHLLRLRTIIPTIEEALQGLLQGQIEEGEARRRYLEAGGVPDWFESAFNIRGTAPTPVQALDLANRGIIPFAGRGPDATTYEQAFLEGPWRNKWLPAFQALAEYLIPPRSIVPLLRSGAITRERAIELMARNGVSEVDALAMTEEAASGKLAADRELTKSEILRAYGDGLLDERGATEVLGGLGYEPEEAGFLLGLADFTWERRFRDASVTRIGNLYKARKITEDEAQAALASLGLPGTAMSKALALWDIERELPTADLTESQVRGAWRKGIVDEDYYRNYLTTHGFSPEEAEILVQLNAPAGG